MKRSLKDLAEQVGGRALGNAAVDLTGVSNIQSAAPGDLVFVEDEKQSPAGARIVRLGRRRRGVCRRGDAHETAADREPAPLGLRPRGTNSLPSSEA